MRRAVGRAPGRVNLIGEHTDYHGGLALPFALDRTTTATVTARGDDVVRIVSGQVDEPWEGTTDGVGRATGWAAYAAGVVWVLREEGWEVPGLDVAIDSDVPLGAGLSSSAALEVAVAVAIAGLLERDLTDPLRLDLVRVCRRAETEVAGAPTGGLDQMASLLCRADHALLIDFSDGSTRDVPLPLAAEGLAILVVDTRVHHAHADGGYADRRAESERGDPRRLRHVRTENARVRDAVAALEAGRLDRAGTPDDGLARVAPRRLRGIGSRAGHRRRQRNGSGSARRPDDRRWVRRLSDRAGGAGPGGRHEHTDLRRLRRRRTP